VKLALVILAAVLLLAGAVFVSACGSSRPTAADYVWAVGEGGTIRATTDGGAHWVSQNSGTTQKLVGVAFADSKHGWAVGQDVGGKYRVILATSDGGTHWVTQLARQGTALWSVACTDGSHAWAAADGDAGWAIMATSDGGRTWTTQASGRKSLGVPIIVFADASHGWVGGFDRVLATSDGGRRWRKELTALGDQEFYDLDFSDAAHGFVVGSDDRTNRPVRQTGAVWTTSDGGASWHELPGPQDEYGQLYRVAAIDPGHLVVSGDGAWFSTDAGAHWTYCTVTRHGKTKKALGGIADDFAFATPSLGWAAGGAIIASTDGGASWSVQLESANWHQNIRAVACLRPRASQ
jgi:photosystem II stability/assembly factor-like uncharacterized protein